MILRVKIFLNFIIRGGTDGRVGRGERPDWLAVLTAALLSPLLPVVKPVLTFKLSLDLNSGELNAGWLAGE